MSKKNWVFRGQVGRLLRGVEEIVVVNARKSQYSGFGIAELAVLWIDCGNNDNRWSVRIHATVEDVAKVIEDAEFDYDSALKFTGELQRLESDERERQWSDYIGLRLETIHGAARIFGSSGPAAIKESI